MNKTVRLIVLTVLALTLTCFCLARSRPGTIHRNPQHVCVPRCASYCSALGMLTYQTCSSCYCYAPPSGMRRRLRGRRMRWWGLRLRRLWWLWRRRLRRRWLRWRRLGWWRRLRWRRRLRRLLRTSYDEAREGDSWVPDRRLLSRRRASHRTAVLSTRRMRPLSPPRALVGREVKLPWRGLAGGAIIEFCSSSVQLVISAMRACRSISS